MNPSSLWTALRPYRTAAVLAVLALAALWRFGPDLVLGPRVEALQVQQRDLLQSVVATGRVEAPHRVNLGSQLVGTVRAVPVAQGETVRAGQLLVELDDSEQRAAAQQADAAVQQAQARLRQLNELQQPLAEQALHQAQVTRDTARAQWQRSTELFRQGFVGQAALDDARKAYELAEAQVRSAQAQLDTLARSGSDYALASTALAQARAAADAARARLAYTRLSAPVAGTLISRAVERGDLVQPGKVLMQLSPAGALQLVVAIDEKNLPLLRLGQSAQVSADAYPQGRFEARLAYINPGINAQNGSVEVRLDVPQPPDYLRQDMTVSVDVRVAERRNVLVLPLDALRAADTDAPWVLRIRDGRAQRQAVRLGLRTQGHAQVLEGLQAGDLLVSASTSPVHEGARVRAAQAAAPGVAAP